MKAERRHELQQNKLAQWVAKVVAQVRPHVRTILLGAMGLAAAIVIVFVWRDLWQGKQSLAWETLFEAVSGPGTAGLETLAEEAPRARSGHWAAFVAAKRHLDEGCRLLFTNKENASEELRKAVAAYTTVIQSSGKGEGELLEPAFFGRAKAYESLAGVSRGNLEDLDNAIADYEVLTTRWPNGPYASTAKRQSATLNSTQGRSFYRKFAAYQPKPLTSRQPGKLPSLEELGKAIPDDADFSKLPLLLPDYLQGPEKTPQKPGAGAPTPDKGQPITPEPPKTALPKAEPAKPAPAKPEAPKSEPAKSEPAKKT